MSAIPLLLTLWFTYGAERPYFIARTDVEADYIYNAWSVLAGHGVIGTYHPGTPLYLLVALVLYAVGHGVEHTQFVLNAVYVFTGFVTSASLWGVMRAALRSFPPGIVALFAAGLLSWPSSVVYFNYVAPDAWVVALGAPLTWLLWTTLSRGPTWHLYALGALAGASLAMKLTFLPLAACLALTTGVHILRQQASGSARWRRLALFASALLGAFALCTLPVLDHMPGVLLYTVVRSGVTPGRIAETLHTVGVASAALGTLGILAVLLLAVWTVRHRRTRSPSPPAPTRPSRPWIAYLVLGLFLAGACLFAVRAGLTTALLQEIATTSAPFVVLTGSGILLVGTGWTRRSSATAPSADTGAWDRPAALLYAFVGLIGLCALASVSADPREGILTRNAAPIALVTPFLFVLGARLWRLGPSSLSPILNGTALLLAVAALGYAGWHGAAERRAFIASAQQSADAERDALVALASPTGEQRLAFWDGSHGMTFGPPSFHFWGNYRYGQGRFDTTLLEAYPRFSYLRLRVLGTRLKRADAPPPATSEHPLARLLLRLYHTRGTGSATPQNYLFAGQSTEDIAAVALPYAELDRELPEGGEAELLDQLREVLGPVAIRSEHIAGRAWFVAERTEAP